ncbi:MAG: class I SAM-dependent methyltransferase [Myxococcota bacterium]|nr:class I SAM-dependent methyltransferase [Myxococcota bacterium]
MSQLTQNTIRHYHECAEDFWEGTKDHDVSQNIAALLRKLPKDSTHILDFGCGPGRDLMTLTKLGYTAIGLDGASEICELARRHSNCEVWQQDFIDLDLPSNFFHGVFANATLFHIPKTSLSTVLEKLHCCLKDNGVVFCSNPRGPDIEQINELRYGNYMDVTGWSAFFNDAGFDYCEHYFRPPGLPRDEQPWLAMVWTKAL